MVFTLEQFDFNLPSERIAQLPLEKRDSSRLFIVNRQTGALKHAHFFDLASLLDERYVIVRNNSKVIPARIFGKKETGGQCEILLIKEVGVGNAFGKPGEQWECLTKPGLKVGQMIHFSEHLEAVCTSITGYTRTLEFNETRPTFFQSLNQIGHTPIPPYIDWEKTDEQKLREVYQTTYAKVQGSVAAPTAGLHFTPELDEQLQQKGVAIEEVTLHVGLGTFLPVQDEQLQEKKLHQEFFQLKKDVAQRLNAYKKQGKIILSVGTTTTRVLETCSQNTPGELHPQSGETDLFIQPGYAFHFVDEMITNFHLPKSSLLMLVSAFVSSPNTNVPFVDFSESSVGRAYETAIAEKYRFYSFGDAMWITQ